MSDKLAATPQPRSSSSGGSSSGASPRGWRIWYRTAIVVVAVIMLGLPWCRTGRTGFQAQGQATLSTGSLHPDVYDHLQPLVDELVEKAATDERLTAYLQQHASLRQEFAQVAPEQAVEILHRRLEVKPVRQKHKTSIHLHFYGSNRAACSLMVRQILRDCQADFSAWKEEKSSTVREAFETRYAAAQAELTEIEKQLRARREIRLDQPSTTQPQRLPNPDWAAMAEEIAANQRQVRTLLETRTSQHPQVQELQRRMERLKERLADTPRHLAPSPEAETLAVEAAHQVEQRQKQIAELERQYQEAKARFAAVEKLKTDADEAIAFLGSITFHAPAERVRVAAIGGHWKSTTLLLVMGWAIFAGLIAYQLAWSAAQPERIFSAQQLAAVAPIPVAGTLTLTTDEKPTRPFIWPFRRCSFVAARGAELALLMLAVCVVLALQTHPGYAQLLWDDPIGALQDALEVMSPRI